MSLEGDRADRAARYAAQHGTPYHFSSQVLTLLLSLTAIIIRQISHHLKKDTWIHKNAKQLSSGLAIGPNQHSLATPPSPIF